MVSARECGVRVQGVGGFNLEALDLRFGFGRLLVDRDFV